VALNSKELQELKDLEELEELNALESMAAASNPAQKPGVPIVDATEDLVSGQQENPFDLAKQAEGLVPTSPGQQSLTKSLMDPAIAFGSSAIKQGSLDYAPGMDSPELQKIRDDSSFASGAGDFIGALFPGTGALKTVKGVGTLAKLPWLARTGVRSGAASGFLEGGARNPGEGGSRAENAGLGGILGGLFGGLGRKASQTGRESDAYRQMYSERFPDKTMTPEDALKSATAGEGRRVDFPRRVQQEIGTALDNLTSRQITPRKEALSKILEGKDVTINPDYLRGFKRNSTLGPERQKGGLDYLAKLLEKKAIMGSIDSAEPGVKKAVLGGVGGKYGANRLLDAASPLQRQSVIAGLKSSGLGAETKIPARDAQALKQYFDSISGYAKQKPFSESSVAKGEKSKAVADLLRSKLSGLDPRVKNLNDPMSEALQLRQSMRAMPEGGPIGVISAAPGSDRSQLLREVDRLAGSNLSGLGADVRGAKGLVPNEITNPFNALMETLKAGKRWTGPVISKSSKYVPEGSRDAIINMLLSEQNK